MESEFYLQARREWETEGGVERATGVEPATSSLGTRWRHLRKNLATICGLPRRRPAQHVAILPLTCHGFPPFPRQLWVMDG
jgi:hypothetical protein